LYSFKEWEKLRRGNGREPDRNMLIIQTTGLPELNNYKENFGANFASTYRHLQRERAYER